MASSARRRFVSRRILVGSVAVACATSLSFSQDAAIVGEVHQPALEHVDQADLMALVLGGMGHEAFLEAFELGDEIFAAPLNMLDGVGANVGNGDRFTRIPRADLNGPGEWANHSPARATGPNGASCTECHNLPFEDGAGLAALNVHRDPFHTGDPGQMIQRNTPHLFGSGALQLLAEEMTEELHALRDGLVAKLQSARRAQVNLETKGVSYGRLRGQRTRNGAIELDYSQVEGLDADLVVKPFQWKGNFKTVRDFNNDASHNELGMDPVELTGFGVDGDSDGVVNEMTVGDVTSMAIYIAGQPRPVTKGELADFGLIAPLTPAEEAAIAAGEGLMDAVGCTDCHIPTLVIEDPVFNEPSTNPNFRNTPFPSGDDPVALGVDPSSPISFNLTTDLLDNHLEDAMGNLIAAFGNFESGPGGSALVHLYSDLKRHDLGAPVEEDIDETGVGASVFLTETLWGVGSTGPYLHNGSATTLTEAILAHGGEGSQSRQMFENLSAADKGNLIAFLESLVLFKLAEEE